MSVDQYCYKYNKDNPDEPHQLVAHWGRHQALQEWMLALFLSKYGEGDFNCAKIDLSVKDVEELIRDIKNGNYWSHNGFDRSKEEKDLDFCNLALAILRDNHYGLYYSPWW